MFSGTRNPTCESGPIISGFCIPLTFRILLSFNIDMKWIVMYVTLFLHLQASYGVAAATDGSWNLYIYPRVMNYNAYPMDARVGSEYVRQVTDGQDLQTVNQVLGSTYDGVIIITGIDVAENKQV